MVQEAAELQVLARGVRTPAPVAVPVAVPVTAPVTVAVAVAVTVAGARQRSWHWRLPL